MRERTSFTRRQSQTQHEIKSTFIIPTKHTVVLLYSFTKPHVWIYVKEQSIFILCSSFASEWVHMASIYIQILLRLMLLRNQLCSWNCQINVPTIT